VKKKNYIQKDCRDLVTVKHGNTSSPINRAEFSAPNKEEKKVKQKTMDINDAHYMMGHLGERALRSILNHHKIKATGVFHWSRVFSA
jgi:hypothetical protein